MQTQSGEMKESKTNITRTREDEINKERYHHDDCYHCQHDYQHHHRTLQQGPALGMTDIKENDRK